MTIYEQYIDRVSVVRKDNEMNSRSRDKDIPTKMNLEIIG